MKHVVTAALLRQRVLVTGFGAFPGAPKNPTAAILRKLERQRGRLERLGIALHCVQIPVVYAGIEPALAEAVARYTPDAILHLGLAARRKHLSVETRAINRAGPLHPDAHRRVPASQTLVSGGPARVATTYPARAILVALQRQGLDARVSIDAGDYVCNATLYRSLLERAAPQVGFLHVPRVRNPAQPKARTRRQKPTLDDLTRATLAAVLVMAQRRVRPRAEPDGPMAPPRGDAPGTR